MSVAGNRFFWKVATAATLAGVVLAASAPRAAVPQLPAKPALCLALPVGTTWSTRTLGSTDQDKCGGDCRGHGPLRDLRGGRYWRHDRQGVRWQSGRGRGALRHARRADLGGAVRQRRLRLCRGRRRRRQRRRLRARPDRRDAPGLARRQPRRLRSVPRQARRERRRSVDTHVRQRRATSFRRASPSTRPATSTSPGSPRAS